MMQQSLLTPPLFEHLAVPKSWTKLKPGAFPKKPVDLDAQDSSEETAASFAGPLKGEDPVTPRRLEFEGDEGDEGGPTPKKMKFEGGLETHLDGTEHLDRERSPGSEVPAAQRSPGSPAFETYAQPPEAPQKETKTQT